MSRATLRRYFRHGLFPQLLVFEAVARLGSVTRAAEELHLAQPTVSTQLKKLSRALDVTLFEPCGRRLKITPAGEALLPACREIMQTLTRTDERLAPFRARETELLRLAAFLQETLSRAAYNSPGESPEKEPWTSRATTTRR